MKWNFWDKKPPPKAELPAWPSDTYEAVKYLIGFYLMDNNSPFREWKSPLVEVNPTLESTVHICVRALQARYFFWLLGYRLGKPEAEIAEDCFLQLLTKMSEGEENDMGTMTGFLLRMIDAAMETAEAEGEQVIKTPSGDVEVPAEYFMALHLLMRMPDSPYYNLQTDPVFNNDDWTLAECLIHGKDAAKAFYAPMIAAISDFDVSKFSVWSWRKKPGAHERHLQRRNKNLLFPADRREVTVSDVLEARRKDDAEFKELREKCSTIELPEDLPANWNGFFHDLREQIDELKERGRRIGGDTSKIMKYLNSTRSNLANVWKECSKNNPEALRLFEIAEASAKAYDEEFKGELGHQLLRDDPCVPSNELVPAMLCEDPDTCASFCKHPVNPPT